MSPIHTIEQISTALDRLIADEYSFFLSRYGKEYNISISKCTYGENPVDLTVKGRGATVAECVEAAMLNFPPQPLSGTQWASNRITSLVTDGEFTETTSS